MSEPRYYVDRRVGCVAVRDQTQVDQEEQLLGPNSSGVKQYWHATVRNPGDSCPTCGHLLPDTWELSSVDIDAAYELCDSLNRFGVEIP